MGKKIIKYKYLVMLLLLLGLLNGYPQKQLQLIELEQELLKEQSNESLIIIYLELSELYLKKNLERSRDYANKALSISTAIHSVTDQILAHQQIGKIELKNANYDLALEFQMKALDLNKITSDLQGTALSTILIGNVYKEIRDYKRAKNQFEQGLKIGNKTKDFYVLAISNFSMGKLEQLEGNNFLSLQYLLLAYDQISLTDKEELKGDMAHNLGKLYAKSNKLNEASEVLLKALRSYEKIDLKEKQAILSHEIGELYELLDDNEKSLIYLKNSLRLAEETGMKAYIKMGYENMSKVYESKKDYKRAYEFLQYYSAIKDVREINELEAKLELAKKKQELVLMEEKEKSERQLRNIRFVFMIVLLSIMIIFSGFMYYAYRQKSAINIELKKATDQANQLRKDKEDFFAYTSHEIRTPLNAVVGMSQLMAETQLTQTQIQYLKTINLSAKNILFLVNDILDLSKIEKGALQLESVSFSLKEMINDICQVLYFKTVEKNITLKSTIDDAIPELICGDPIRVNQILLNLADNAVKFTESGYVKILASQINKTADSSTIEFRVEDSGIGIQKEKINTVFDSYNQESSDTTRQYGGTGLGLAISKELVSLMGGKIQVSSTQGKGSSFYFTLTMKKGNPDDYRVSLYIDSNIPLYDLNLLLADDNALNRDVFYDLINNPKKNVTVDLAVDGLDAINKLKENDYDVILLDLQMPKKDGFETAKYIRNKMPERVNKIPIIAMTAHVLEGVSERCIEAGMDDYVSKPINTKLLALKINALLNREEYQSEYKKTKLDQKNDEKKSVIDLSIIEKISKNKPDKILKYVDLYLTNVPIDLDKMRKAMERSEYKKVEELAHKIKGNVSYMGMNSIIPDLSNLENISRNKINSNEILNIVNRVAKIISLSFDELNTYKKKCLI